MLYVVNMHIDCLMTVKQACQAMDLTKAKSCSCCADNHKCTSLVVGAQTSNDNFELRQKVSNFQSKDEVHCSTFLKAIGCSIPLS